MADHRRTPRLTPWARVVAASAVVVVGGLAAMAAWTLASSHKEFATFAVRGMLDGVALDVDDADVVIVRGGGRSSVGVERTDSFTFDHRAVVERGVSDRVFRLRSRCPETVLDTCHVAFRVIVPDNIPVDVRTGSGAVTLDGYRGSARVATRSGPIDVEAFCGFSLQARSERGDIEAGAACAPQQLSLRSTRGGVHAIVPPGRYEVEAESAGGTRTVRGLSVAGDSPFSIQALSSSGDVVVEGGP